MFKKSLVKIVKRTDFEICKLIFEALFQKNPVYKSDLRELVGLGPKSINKWIDLITFIQSQPKIKITKIGRNQVLELETPSLEKDIYPETIEALKVMRLFLRLSPDELKKKLELLR